MLVHAWRSAARCSAQSPVRHPVCDAKKWVSGRPALELEDFRCLYCNTSSFVVSVWIYILFYTFTRGPFLCVLVPVYLLWRFFSGVSCCVFCGFCLLYPSRVSRGFGTQQYLVPRFSFTPAFDFQADGFSRQRPAASGHSNDGVCSAAFMRGARAVPAFRTSFNGSFQRAGDGFRRYSFSATRGHLFGVSTPTCRTSYCSLHWALSGLSSSAAPRHRFRLCGTSPWPCARRRHGRPPLSICGTAGPLFRVYRANPQLASRATSVVVSPPARRHSSHSGA